jgi:cell division ATPase FtsA
MARQKIVENVPRDLVLGEVVLTGGGALLPGIEPLAEEVFQFARSHRDGELRSAV